MKKICLLGILLTSLPHSLAATPASEVDLFLEGMIGRYDAARGQTARNARRLKSELAGPVFADESDVCEEMLRQDYFGIVQGNALARQDLESAGAEEDALPPESEPAKVPVTVAGRAQLELFRALPQPTSGNREKVVQLLARRPDLLASLNERLGALAGPLELALRMRDPASDLSRHGALVAPIHGLYRAFFASRWLTNLMVFRRPYQLPRVINKAWQGFQNILKYHYIGGTAVGMWGRTWEFLSTVTAPFFTLHSGYLNFGKCQKTTGLALRARVLGAGLHKLLQEGSLLTSFLRDEAELWPLLRLSGELAGRFEAELARPEAAEAMDLVQPGYTPDAGGLFQGVLWFVDNPQLLSDLAILVGRLDALTAMARDAAAN